MTKKKFAAYGHVFDAGTLRTLFSLSGQGAFDDLESPIAVGKESHVFTARFGGGHRCVKVYRLSANFKQMHAYMHADPRFSHIKGTKLTVIYAWAMKEYRNLLRARTAGVSVPTPYAVRKNVLVMEYFPAPLLLYKPPKNPRTFYNDLRMNLQKLLGAGLVHADFSEYNILNDRERPVLIDFSHAVDLQHPMAEGYFQRDVKNMVNFFSKQGLSLNEHEEGVKLWKHRK